MTLTVTLIIAYLIALIGNIIILRRNVGGLGDWLAMLACPRHGLILNIIAHVIIFFPPITFAILLSNLFEEIREKRRG